MVRLMRLSAACVVLVAASVLAACGGSSSSVPTPAATQGIPGPAPVSVSGGKIQHVLILVQENRTVDDLFQGLPNADTSPTGLTYGGQTVPLAPIPLSSSYDLTHEYYNYLSDYDGGAMDGFASEVASAGPGGKIPPDPAYVYVQQQDVQPYFQLAEHYAFADRMFQSNEGPSFPAHQFLISGTSAPSAESSLLASTNPGDEAHDQPNGGCDSPPDVRVGMIDSDGDQGPDQYPCFDHQTLMDVLDQKQVSWKYYEPRIGGYWDGPDAILHIRQSPSDWARVIVPETTVLGDIAGGDLAQVSWVIPNGLNSDHPGSGDGGPSWVTSVVDAVGASPYWDSTVIFVTWDDWGGFYDHVKPTQFQTYEDGFRVPLLVISPYARAGYVSHRMHDFGSLLRFVEDNWQTDLLGYEDDRSDDLADCFDFNQAPLTFQAIRAKYPASHFTMGIQRFVPPDDR